MDTDSRSIFKVATFEHVSKNSSTETTRSQPPSLFLFCSLYTHFPIAHLLGYSNDRMCVSFVPKREKSNPFIHQAVRGYISVTLPPIRPPFQKKNRYYYYLHYYTQQKTTHQTEKEDREKSSFFFPFFLSPFSSPSSSSPKSTCTTTETGVKGKAVGRDYQRGIISFFSHIVSFFASSWQCATFLMDRQTHKTIHGNGQGDRECVRIRISIDFLPSSSSPPQKI